MHYGRFLRGVDTGFNGVKDCYLGLRHFIALLLSCGFVVIGCGGRGGGSGGGALYHDVGCVVGGAWYHLM